MLTKRTEPDGKVVYVRPPYRAEDYTPTKEDLTPITDMDWMSIRNLLKLPDHPFGNFWIDKVERDGKTWWRFSEMMKEWCILIEDQDDDMRISWGEIRVLPPEEALALARSYDAKRGFRVIDQS